MPFPDYSTPFGDIYFDFIDYLNSFVIIFSRKSSNPFLSFWQGEVSVETNPDDFEIHKEKLLRDILSLIQQPHITGIDLQKAIIIQLRLSFKNITLSSDLESALNP